MRTSRSHRHRSRWPWCGSPAFVVAHAHFDRCCFLTPCAAARAPPLGASWTALLPHRELPVHRLPPQESGPDATSPYYNQQSLVDFEFPDPLLFPDFPRAAAEWSWRGDVLYIPPFWWHRVEALHDAPRTQGDEEEKRRRRRRRRRRRKTSVAIAVCIRSREAAPSAGYQLHLRRGTCLRQPSRCPFLWSVLVPRRWRAAAEWVCPALNELAPASKNLRRARRTTRRNRGWRCCRRR